MKLKSLNLANPEGKIIYCSKFPIVYEYSLQINGLLIDKIFKSSGELFAMSN